MSTETLRAYSGPIATLTTNSAGLARIGSLLADDTRAEILCALLDGRAHTGGELSRHIGVAASTISEHLSELLDGDIVTVEAQGHHRYFSQPAAIAAIIAWALVPAARGLLAVQRRDVV